MANTDSGSAADKTDKKDATAADAAPSQGAVDALAEVADQLEAHAAENEGQPQQATEAHQGRRHGLRDALALVEEKIKQLGGRRNKAEDATQRPQS